MTLRDIIGALNIQINYKCHVALESIKETLIKYTRLYSDFPILQIYIFLKLGRLKEQK